MRIKEIERDLAQEISKVRKEIVGKGPTDMQVFIHGNTIFIKSKGQWNSYEQYLLSFIEKRQLIAEVQYPMIEQGKPYIERILSRYVEVKIIDISVKIYVERNEMIAFILLDCNFEKELEKRDR